MCMSNCNYNNCIVYTCSASTCGFQTLSLNIFNTHLKDYVKILTKEYESVDISSEIVKEFKEPTDDIKVSISKSRLKELLFIKINKNTIIKNAVKKYSIN